MGTAENTSCEAQPAENGSCFVPDSAELASMTDESLFALYLKTEDEKVYSALFERYHGEIALFINVYIRNLKDAETLMQEAISDVIMHKPDIRDADWFRPYLYRAARNKALRYLEKRGRISEITLEKLPPDLIRDHKAEAYFENLDQRMLLITYLDQLKPEYSDALRLVYLEGMSYAEAAEAMQRQPEQIKHLVARGKQAMKKLMEE